ncbi:MAG TPA: hypothetical protein PLC89_16210 [Haliscomenobacter sp.]|uniref:hypothetical protein n=1 Tax=Haliscomenobacter sp. TaxID=2717303 RepID=UPI002B9A05FF|nr:hypothetical protein [Haliscomenobacter sp.]HOY18848.1 hypothetical protein [Haliscomenobacter sp.]
MHNHFGFRRFFPAVLGVMMATFFCSCEAEELVFFTNDAAVFLVIDEESIDNGNEPNNFSERDVNDQLAEVGIRQSLRYFQNNVGEQIDLYTGEVGDEGWHALKTIPNSWINAGPSSNGLLNFLAAGPGLGGGEDDREVLLDKIPNVTPLRATGLAMLKGKTVVALVYDGDISINYAPLNGNLMGANLGLVAFDVLEVSERKDGSSSSLPRVSIRIRSVTDVSALPLALFSNAPLPKSSSEPFDIVPSNTPPLISLTPAN